MRIRPNCPKCLHTMDLGEASQPFEGEIRCFHCRSRLEVKKAGGQLRSMRPKPTMAPPVS